MAFEILVSLTRGNLEESHHHGAYFGWKDGAGLRTRGGLETPFQAIAVVESGAPDRYGFTEEEMALVVGSHSGSPRHAAVAASILQKAGADAGLLRCGGHQPLDRKVHEEYVRQGYEPGRIEDNCSGKHAGMIAAARARGEDPKRYADPDHPVQRDNLNNVALLCAVHPGTVRVGTDGCAAPNFAVPVSAMARAAAVFTTPTDLGEAKAKAARRIFKAVQAHPDMVAGEGRFDTELMRLGKGRILSKEGAEGVQIIGVRGERLGIAIKIADGASRAVHAVAGALLVDLGILGASDLAGLVRRQVRTREGTSVGEVKVRL